MPRRTQKKRAQRRQRDLENDINTNGIDDHRGGTFKVYDRKKGQRSTKGLLTGNRPSRSGTNAPDYCYHLNEQHRMGR